MPLGFGRKKYSTVQVRKRDVPDGLWDKCPGCDEILYAKERAKNLEVCPKCGHHFMLPRQQRIDLLTDEGSFQEWDADMTSADPLGFTGKDSYVAKLEANQKKTGFKDAVTCGAATLNGRPVGISVMDFKFLGASMGSVVGEKLTRQIERCTEQKMPCIIVCASGGARMYEGLFSLMQMAKTSAALARHAEAGLPYIPVLTHPTMAGVMASFATLGDVIVAEPGALIGFAGPRVIKETTQQDLPEGFQRAEFLQDHGLIDMVVPRHELKERLAQVLDYMMES
jgi:acetyl-CoA carboxylase carboxyl transferase subunit beta